MRKSLTKLLSVMAVCAVLTCLFSCENMASSEKSSGGSVPATPSLSSSWPNSNNRTVVLLEWNSVSGATGYNIYGSLSSGSGYQKLWSTTDSDITIYGLIDGKTRYYKITAYNSNGESSHSNYVTVSTLSCKLLTVNTSQTYTFDIPYLTCGYDYYYYFNASSGKKYYVPFCDKEDGASTVTSTWSKSPVTDIKVSVYTPQGTKVINADTGWTTTRSFTATETGDYVMVVTCWGISTNTNGYAGIAVGTYPWSKNASVGSFYLGNVNKNDVTAEQAVESGILAKKAEAIGY